MGGSFTRRAVVTGGAGDLARAVVAELNAIGYGTLAPGRGELDVSDKNSVRVFFDRTGAVDLLVHSAGIAIDRLALNQSATERGTVMGVNLRGAFLCARAVLPGMMKRRSGHLIFIGSYSAHSGPAGQSAYAAAKAALIGLSHSLAREAGPRNVRSNVVLPGWLDTKFTQSVPEEARGRALAAHALGRFNTIGDAARFIGFLDGMSHVSGQVFQLDSRVRAWA